MQILRIIAGVLIGLIIGSIVNMGLIIIGSGMIPPPAGVDPSDAESIAASIHLFEAKHFVFPFIAHAMGTLVGALIAFLIAGEKKDMAAYVVGAAFLAGGITAAFMIPAPVWFIALDVILSYIPMAFLAIKIGSKFSPNKANTVAE